MIKKLKEIETNELFSLLEDSNNWQTLDIDYLPPRVERLWLQYDDEHRLLIHRIHTCTKEEALFHPHPWKSAVHVLPFGGHYGHSVGTVNQTTEVYCNMEVHGEMYYEMLHIDGFHSVRPISMPVYSIMLIGKPLWKDHNTDEFNETLEVKPVELKPLSNEVKEEILNEVREYVSWRFPLKKY